jgi:hypothetical protein
VCVCDIRKLFGRFVGFDNVAYVPIFIAVLKLLPPSKTVIRLPHTLFTSKFVLNFRRLQNAVHSPSLPLKMSYLSAFIKNSVTIVTAARVSLLLITSVDIKNRVRFQNVSNDY